jgi:hypothetical protein
VKCCIEPGSSASARRSRARAFATGDLKLRALRPASLGTVAPSGSQDLAFVGAKPLHARRAGGSCRICTSGSASGQATRPVDESLPVVFFGDALSARIATVGLNPSKFEYLDRNGELADSAQRFATFRSLGAPSRADLTDAQSDEAIDVMRAHYDAGRPVYGSYSGISRTSYTAWALAIANGLRPISISFRRQPIPCGAA